MHQQHKSPCHPSQQLVSGAEREQCWDTRVIMNHVMVGDFGHTLGWGQGHKTHEGKANSSLCEEVDQPFVVA